MKEGYFLTANRVSNRRRNFFCLLPSTVSGLLEAEVLATLSARIGAARELPPLANAEADERVTRGEALSAQFMAARGGGQCAEVEKKKVEMWRLVGERRRSSFFFFSLSRHCSSEREAQQKKKKKKKKRKLGYSFRAEPSAAGVHPSEELLPRISPFLRSACMLVAAKKAAIAAAATGAAAIKLRSAMVNLTTTNQTSRFCGEPFFLFCSQI